MNKTISQGILKLTRRRIENVRGVLQAHNIDNNHWGSQPSGGLYEFNQRSIEELFATMTQSDSFLLLYQVEWSFIIDPNTFTTGGSKKVTVPTWVKRNRKNWTTLTDDVGPIACAAVALCRSINTYRSDKYGEAKLIDDARKLQTEMGWGQYVSISELEKFVLKNPTYRLSCLTSAERNFLDYSYVGKQFEGVQVFKSGSMTPPNCLYIYFDIDQKHYVHVSAPASFYRQLKNNDCVKFCHHCVCMFYSWSEHKCNDELTYDNVKRKAKNCKECGRMNCTNCDLISCRNCKAKYLKGHYYHRCAVMVHEKEDKGYNLGENDGKKPSLWTYDLEARIEITDSKVAVPCPGLDENGFYVETQVFSNKIDKQVANFVTLTNVFTKEKKQFFGDDCLNEFITFVLNHNRGNSIWLAHNAASYDSRLIFDCLVSRKNALSIHPTLNGGKFMEIRVGSKIFFRDSRLHLTGSLSSLAKDFGLESKKGHFPHLFNSIKNYQYNGPIPARKHYDLSSFKTDKEFESFSKWHQECAELYKINHVNDSYSDYQYYDEWFEEWYQAWLEKPKHNFFWNPKEINQIGEWNFIDELYSYGVNDTDMLAEIAESYHDIYNEKFKQSPWKHMTTASFFHKCCLIQITQLYELPEPSSDDYESKVHEAAEKYWAVLKGPEYAMVSKCVRGGRTEIKKVLCELNDEEIKRGCALKVVDVVSLYPYVQVARKYPCGIPTIHVFDERFLPCHKHRNSMEVECGCPESNRMKAGDHDLRFALEPDWTREEFMVRLETSGGYVCATVIPSNMVHPVLVHYDRESLKCMASCDKLVKGYFTAVEFLQALKCGYQIEKVHRFDEYKMAEPIWADFVKSMYIFKMINSRDSPKGQERENLINTYENEFDMGDEIFKTLHPEDLWGKRSAKKLAAKIGLNSGWGKHCQRPRMVQSQVANYKDSVSRKECNTLFQNVSKNITTIKSAIPLATDSFMYKFVEDGAELKLDLTLGYIAAACYVPAYGRLKLWEQLNQLGERVFFNDTDSVGYVYDPQEYNVSMSSILGGWEETDESKIGIDGFVGIAPKSYAMKLKETVKDNLVTPGQDYIKLKGIMQSRSTNNFLTYQKLFNMVKKGVETKGPQVINVPQKLFKYKLGQGIETRFVYKQLTFDKDHQKGFVKDYFVYPKGYLFQ